MQVPSSSSHCAMLSALPRTEANAARSVHMVGSWVSTLTTASATAAMHAKCPACRVKGCCTAKQSLGVASQKSVLY